MHCDANNSTVLGYQCYHHGLYCFRRISDIVSDITLYCYEVIFNCFVHLLSGLNQSSSTNRSTASNSLRAVSRNQ